MKLHYYADTDSLYVEFKPGPGTETRAVCNGLNVDLDDAGDIVGFDIDGASRRLDLSTPEVEALPVLYGRLSPGGRKSESRTAICGKIRGLRFEDSYS